MNTKSVTMENYPIIENSYKYVCYDGLSFNQVEEEVGLPSDLLRDMYIKYLKAGGTLPSSDAHLISIGFPEPKELSALDELRNLGYDLR